MDQFYFEEGFIEASYFVYIAEARVDLRPYIEENYIDPQYYEYYGIAYSLTADLTEVFNIIEEAEAQLSALFTVSVDTDKIKEAVITITSAFTPVMTVNAQLAGVALLETVATMQITAVANRSTEITLSTIGNLNAQAAKTADSLSALTAEFAQSTTAIIPTLATASLSAITSLYASRYTGTGRPRDFDEVTLSSTSKFGNYSLDGIRTYYVDYSDSILKYGANNVPEWTEDWAIEAWVYIKANASGNHEILRYQKRSTAADSFVRLAIDGSERLIYGKRVGDSTPLINYTSSPLALTTWHHVLLVRDGTNDIFSLFLNGSRVFTETLTVTTYFTGIDQENRILIGGSNILVDEVSFHRGTTLGYSASSTSITVPTSARTNDPDTTEFLYHFEDRFDDITVLASAQATLVSTSSLTAQANANTKQGQATLAGQFAQTSTAFKIIESASAVSSEFTQSTTAEVTRSTSSELAAETTVTATAYRIIEASANVDSLFTPNVDADVQLAGVALLEAQFTQTALAQKTTDVDSTAQSEFATTVLVEITRNVESIMQSEATVAATVIRIQTAESQLASEFAVSADAYKIQEVDSAVSAEFTQTTEVARTRDLDTAMSSTVIVSALVGVIKPLASSLDSETTISASTSNVIRITAAFTAETQAEITAVKTTDVISTQTSESTQTTAAVKTVDVEVLALSLFSPSFTVNLTARPLVYIESTFTQSATATRIFDIELEPPISGVNFTGNSLIKIRNNQPVSLPTQTNDFVLAFWAYSPLGTLLDWYPFDVNGNRARLRFNSGQLVWENWVGDNSTDRRAVTWNIDADSWHHYLILAEPLTTIRLYQDGVEITGAVTTVNDGTTPPAPPSQDQIDIEYTWILGANTSNWRNFINEVNNGARSIVSMSGAVTQFLAYWTNTPDATDALVREKFYDEGYLDLGLLGVDTGLPRPDIYLRLNSSDDQSQLGTVTDKTVEWRRIYNSNYDPTWDTVNWSLTETFTPTAANDTSPGFLARSNLIAGVSGVFLFDLDIDSEFTQSATAYKIVENPAALTAQSTLTIAGGGGIFGGVADLSTDSTVSCEISKITGLSAQLATEATITAVAGFFESFDSALSAEFTLDASVTVKPPIRTEAALTASTTLVADVASFTDATVLLATLGEITCDVTVIPPIRAEADLSAEFTVTAVIGSIEQFAALVASAGTMTIDAVKNTGIYAEQYVITATAVTEAKKFTGIIETLEVQGFQLTLGEVINLDPALTLIIEPESRTLTILPESRLLNIDSESRLLTIIRG